MSHKQLNNYGLRLKKSLGQNFLNNEEVVIDMVESVEYEKDLIAIEVGTGLGILTKKLANKFDYVISYEVDKSLKERIEFELEEYKNIEVRFEDFLNSDSFNQLDKDKKYIFCANLPYYITSPILFKLFNSDYEFNSITVMIQKEVADRFTAKVNDSEYNDLSVISNYLYDVKRIRNVSKKYFTPIPKVDSTIIQFIPKDRINEVDNQDKLFELIKDLFAYRRKTILNNLSLVLNDKESAKSVLDNLNIEYNKRAQELDIDDFIKIYEVLKERL